MLDINTENQILKELITLNDFSEKTLKKIYRRLSKKFHPDLSNKSGDEFVKLQKDYEEAKEFIKNLKFDVSFVKDNDKENIDPRAEFYDKLYYYTVSGLHSIKIRIKPKLKERNDKIIEQVLYWAEKYNPLFIPIFKEYNKIFFIPLNEMEVAKKIYRAQKLMIKGLYFFFDYQKNGLESYKNIAISYIEDSLYELKLLDYSDYQKSIVDFAEFILKELIMPPICK